MNDYTTIYHHYQSIYEVDGDKYYIYDELFEYIYENLNIVSDRDALRAAIELGCKEVVCMHYKLPG